MNELHLIMTNSQIFYRYIYTELMIFSVNENKRGIKVTCHKKVRLSYCFQWKSCIVIKLETIHPFDAYVKMLKITRPKHQNADIDREKSDRQFEQRNLFDDFFFSL